MNNEDLKEKEEVENDESSPLEEKSLSRRGFIAGVVGTAAATMLPAAAKAVSFAGKSSSAGQIVYKIHPAIGVARLGNADPSTFFVGPESPGFDSQYDGTGAPPYPRKVNGLIKPQGARFRIWQYQYDANGNLQPIQEVNLQTAGVTNITWNAHLANKKSSFYQFGGLTGENQASLGPRNATVANRSTLETDFGPRFISGSNAAPTSFQVSGTPGETYPKKADGTPVINYLGQLRTDFYGRLIVLGGKGVSNYSTATAPALPSYANNDNWFDDISDGPISATITVSGVTYPVTSAWVLVAPPDFAPRVYNMVTLYDLLFDMAVRNLPIPANDGTYMPGGGRYRIAQLKSAYKPGAGPEFPGILPDFDSEINPVLQCGYNYFYVESLIPTKHTSLIDPTLGQTNSAYNANRQFILGYMRQPTVVQQAAKGKATMPHILGDDAYNPHAPLASQYLALTHVQYGLMTNWASGNFVAAGTNPPPTATITPWGLDRAALENCVGGAFFPGIEASWQIRNPKLFIEPFRIDPNAVSQYLGPNGQALNTQIGPGNFSQQMAVPWQADFNDCRSESSNAWWPAQRPDNVYVESNQTRIIWARPDNKFAVGGNISAHQDMVNNWWKFGFVVYDGVAFVESERNSGIA